MTTVNRRRPQQVIQEDQDDAEFDPNQFKKEIEKEVQAAQPQEKETKIQETKRIEPQLNFKGGFDDSDASDSELSDDSNDSDLFSSFSVISHSYDQMEDERVVKNFQQQKMNTLSLEKQNQLLSENKKINLNYVDHKLEMSLNNKVNNALKTTQNKIDDEKIRVKDKNDRATVDQVLDPRTLIIFHKMVNNKKIEKLHGCLSTGKEANVYLADGYMDLETMQLTEVKREFAVKVFKTSILVFKDRERYVSGEFRFRKGHCKSNPRKMVQLWAEKEVRNLKRLNMTNGLIKAPKPYLLKNNIIVMEFIGENGMAAPRLKDADIPDVQQTYVDVLFIMRRMYQNCRLVHADFSEYNMLFYKGEVYVIDVSQAVEHDHPMSLDFLRRDCANINDYFHKKGIQTLNVQQAFDFVSDITIENEHEYLTKLFTKANEVKTVEEEIRDEVFKHVYIPRTLQELTMEEIDKQKRENNEILYEKLTGVQSTEKEERHKQQQNQKDEHEIQEVKSDSSDSEEEQDSNDEGEENDEDKKEGEEGNDEEGKPKRQTVCLKGMTKDEKKEHKKKVKEEKKEKRKTKIPKYVKKKAEKKNKH